MGVSGLLPVLKPITERVNVSTFRGRRVGVDGFAWLHRGGYACALELATGAPTSGYLTHFLHRVNLLLHHGVVPVVVFDGAPLPMKADTNAERRASRAEARRAGEAALAVGDRRAATEYFQRCVTVTPEMVAAVMGALRPLGVDAMVAPYEADAQLAFLAATGAVDAVITEDSDLVVYGVPTLLFKMSKFGDADRIHSADLPDVPDPPMRHSTPDMLLWTAVLAGCDFFPGVPGLGVKRAHGLVRQFAGNLGRLLAFVSAEPRLRVPPTFIADFHRACLVFRHQVVWDPSARQTVHLTPLSAAALQHVPPTMVAEEDASATPYGFLGAHPPPDVAAAVVRSELHPITHQQLVPRGTAAAPVVRPRSAWQPRGAGGGASVPLVARVEEAEAGAASGMQGGIRSFLVSKQSAAAVRKPFKRPRPAAAPSQPANDAVGASSSLGEAVTLIAQQVGALPAGTRGGSALPSFSAPPSVGRPYRVGQSPEIANFLSSTRVDGGAAGANAKSSDAPASGLSGDVDVGGAAGRRRRNKVIVSAYFASPQGRSTAQRRTTPSLEARVEREADVAVPNQQGPTLASLAPSSRPASPRPAALQPTSSRPASPRPASPRPAFTQQTRRQLPSRPLSRSPSTGSQSQVERAGSRAWSLPLRPRSPLPRRMLWEEKGLALYQLSRGSSSTSGGAFDWDEVAEAEADAALAEADAEMVRASASAGRGSPSEDNFLDEQGVGVDIPDVATDNVPLFPLLPETPEQEEITSSAIEAAAAADVAARFGRRAGTSRATLPSSSMGPLTRTPVLDDESSAEAEEDSRPPSPDSYQMEDFAPSVTRRDAAAAALHRRSRALSSSAPSGADEQQVSAPRLPRRQLAEHRPFRSQLLRGAGVRVSLPLPMATDAASPVTPAADVMSRLAVLRCSRAASGGGGASVERRRRRPPSPPPLAAGRTAAKMPPRGSGTAVAGAPRSLGSGDPGCTPVSPAVTTPSAPQQRPMAAVDDPGGVALVRTQSDVVYRQQQAPADGQADGMMTLDDGPAAADSKPPAAGDGQLFAKSGVAAASHGEMSSCVHRVVSDVEAELPTASIKPEKLCPTTVAQPASSTDGQLPSASAGVGLSGAQTTCPSPVGARSGLAALVEKPASLVADGVPSLVAVACAGSPPCPPYGSERLPCSKAVLAAPRSSTQPAELTLGVPAAAEPPPRSTADADVTAGAAADTVLPACMHTDRPLARASPSPGEPPASRLAELVAPLPPPPTSAARGATPRLVLAPASRVAAAPCTPPATPPSPPAAADTDDSDRLPRSRLSPSVAPLPPTSADGAVSPPRSPVSRVGTVSGCPPGAPPSPLAAAEMQGADVPPRLPLSTPVAGSADDPPRLGDTGGTQAAVLPPSGSLPRGVGSQPSVASVVVSTEPVGSELLKNVPPSVDSGALLPPLAPGSPGAQPLPGSAMSP